MPRAYAPLWILVCLASLLVSGTATAKKKVDLTGATATLSGKWQVKLRDGSRELECGKQQTSMNVSFGAGRQWSGTFDGQAIGGTWKQKGKKGQEVKTKLDSRSESVLNQAIDDAVSSCILSIPDGLPVTIRKTKLKVKLNKKGDKLLVKLAVDFRSKEDGLLWDMKGDDKDVFDLKVKGGVATQPNSSSARVVQLTAGQFPPVPADLVAGCSLGPNDNSPCATFPGIEYRGYLYLAFQFRDNRFAMAIVGYDSAGRQISRQELSGGRYLWGVEIDERAQTITILTQQGIVRAIGWSELRR